MRYQFVLEHQDLYVIQIMCDVLEVSRSGFYAWRNRKPSERKIADAKMIEDVTRVFNQHRGRYGYARIWRQLQTEGIACGKHRVRRLMRENSLVAIQPKRYKQTTKANPDHPVAPNLLNRDFQAEAPNQKWCADITYIPTGEGWLYLAVIIDLFSRRVVGWSMDKRMTQMLVADALRMAVKQRQPAAGLIHHSDRGSQYTAHDFQKLLAVHGIVPSMSRTGDCYDNAVAESFFGTLKMELVDQTTYATRADAEINIFFYVEGYYNRERIHSTLGYRTPMAIEAGYDPHLT
jgi:transposase InsO family protein